jgi:hypothetical protein
MRKIGYQYYIKNNEKNGEKQNFREQKNEPLGKK